MNTRSTGRPDLSATDLAYLAGIIDGEGTIGIYKGGGPYSYYLRLIVTNSSLPLMKWVHAGVGGSFIKQRRDTDRHAQIWYVILMQQRAAHLIRRCLPYIIVKRAQADNALEFIDEFVSSRGTGRAPSDQELARRIRHYEEALRLNGGWRRGRPRFIRERSLRSPGASTIPPLAERR
jgi:hypothetical protein